MRSMLMRSLFVPVLGLVAVAVAGPAAAIEASGQAVAVVRNTAASGPGGDRALAAKGAGLCRRRHQDGPARHRPDPLRRQHQDGGRPQFAGDRSTTSSSRDRPRPAAFAINAVRGSFRFITGVSAKNAYSINTPTATIGVRGTAFDGHVAEDGTTTIAMWHGTVRICDKGRPRRHCTEISGACSVIQLDPGCGLQLGERRLQAHRPRRSLDPLRLPPGPARERVPRVLGRLRDPQHRSVPRPKQQ